MQFTAKIPRNNNPCVFFFFTERIVLSYIVPRLQFLKVRLSEKKKNMKVQINPGTKAVYN